MYTYLYRQVKADYACAQGYLKAARCYRLLKKLKAAQRMLDMAVECAEDEATLKAVRTEQRKINEDAVQVAQERSRVSLIDAVWTMVQ